MLYIIGPPCHILIFSVTPGQSTPHHVSIYSPLFIHPIHFSLSLSLSLSPKSYFDLTLDLSFPLHLSISILSYWATFLSLPFLSMFLSDIYSTVNKNVNYIIHYKHLKLLKTFKPYHARSKIFKDQNQCFHI